MVTTLNLNALGQQHGAWVERMGWHNKTVLEGLALIASEIGEANAECVGRFDREKFGEELADIVLRTVDMAFTENVNLDDAVAQVNISWQSLTLNGRMAEILIDYAAWTNTARKTELGPDFHAGMVRFIARVLDLARQLDIDLQDHLRRKVAKNELRGTRGRII